MVIVSPSILSADFSKLGSDIRQAVEGGAEWLHIDVMDGHFVPNLSFGAPIVKCIRPTSNIVFDAHLMVTNPKDYIEDFKKAGADYLTVHAESEDWMEALAMAREGGMKTGISINPDTPLEAVEDQLGSIDLLLVMSVHPGFAGQSFIPDVLTKVTKASKIREEKGYDFLISVDGGVGAGNADMITAAGADVVVAGSAVFKQNDIPGAVRAIKEAAGSVGK